MSISSIGITREFVVRPISSIGTLRSINMRRESALGTGHTIIVNNKSSLATKHLIGAFGRSSIAFRRAIHAPFGYNVYATNVATQVTTFLGFIDGNVSPLELTGITLADATYDLEFRLSGHYWGEQRFTEKFRVEILAGAPVVAAPPPLLDVTTEQFNDSVRLRWRFEQSFGTLVPDEFGIWTDTVGPPVTTGAPDFTEPAFEPRAYETVLDQAGMALFIAIAARTLGVNGPVSNVSEPTPLTAPSPPDNQFAEEEPEA